MKVNRVKVRKHHQKPKLSKYLSRSVTGKFELDKQMFYWKLNPKRKIQITGGILSKNSMGEKESNQVMFHPTNSLSVEAGNFWQKDKELQMYQEEPDILKHVSGSKVRKHYQKQRINIYFKPSVAQKVDSTATRLSGEVSDFWPEDKGVEANLKEPEIIKRVLLKNFESHLSCSICSEVFIKPVKLPCMHTFCKTCIFQWERNKKDCPICRAKYKAVSLEDTPLLNCIEELIGSTYTNDEKKERDELVKSRADLERKLLSSKFKNTQIHGFSSLRSLTDEMLDLIEIRAELSLELRIIIQEAIETTDGRGSLRSCVFCELGPPWRRGVLCRCQEMSCGQEIMELIETRTALAWGQRIIIHDAIKTLVRKIFHQRHLLMYGRPF